MPGTPAITHLERRKIEAGVLIPMVQAFQRAVGKERANEIAKEVILELARKDGERWAQQFGDDLAAMEKVSGVWAGGGSLEIKKIGKSAQTLDFDVTRCGYAEFYKELGLPELGIPVPLQPRLRHGRGIQPRASACSARRPSWKAPATATSASRKVSAARAPPYFSGPS